MLKTERRTAGLLPAFVALAMIALLATAASGQISSVTITNTGDGDSTNDGLTDGEQRLSTRTVSNTATTISGRYSWVTAADSGIFTNSSITLNAGYRINFNVNVPGAYILTVNTHWAGGFTTVDDGGGTATADVGALTGAQTGGTLASGTLSLTDPGSRASGSTGMTNFGGSLSAAATITGLSNGSNVPHQISFSWASSCNSPGGSQFLGADECAVRAGMASTLSGQTAGDYPGAGGLARTQASDGHFVDVSITSLCGNSVVDGGSGEQCDEGPLNGLGGSCCTSNCQFRPANDVCRLATDGCDAQEVCTGSSGSCPADGVKTAGTVCRAGSAGEICDITETCDGVNAACPPDLVEPASTVCRNAAGVCDLAENCTGASKFCPADAKSTAVCRGSAGVCDLVDSCDGFNNDCPADAKSTSMCRASAGVCDLQENCNGVGNDCPNDNKRNPFFVCRSSAGACDLQETCDGVNNACPADAKSTAVCRGAAGSCDVAESCDGSSDTCPSDQFQPSSQVCRVAITACDVAENCTGTGAACPADAVQPNGTACPGDGNVCTVDECDGVSKFCLHPAGNAGAICRAGTPGQVCDVTELCDGVNTACPADEVETAGTACTADSNVCTLDECDGTSKNCTHPAGNAGTTCRSGSPGEVCDVDEVCDGVNTACPPDLVEPNTTECRASAGGCDIAENCNGVGKTCPPDAVQPNLTVCRAGVGACDIAETCNGVSTACPPDAVQPNMTTCRADAGDCDVAETCDGITKLCPADGFESSGTPCTADGSVCTVDECDGSGSCTHTPGNAGTECRASTGECDVAEQCDGVNASCPADGFVSDGMSCTDDGLFCTGSESCQSGSCVGDGDPCMVGTCSESTDQCLVAGCQVAPLNGCRQAVKSIFLVKDNTTDSKDKLIFKWIKGDLTDKTEFADPTATATYDLCIYSSATEDLVGTAQVGPSALLWDENTKGYKYKDSDGTQSGIQKIIVKAGAQGKAKALVKGKGVNLPDLPAAANSSLDLDLPVRVQLVNSDSGVCFEGTFDSGDIRKNEPGKFKGKASN